MSEFITVQTPEGPVRFPKGMSRADMAAALNKLTAARKTSPGAEAAKRVAPSPSLADAVSIKRDMFGNVVSGGVKPTTSAGMVAGLPALSADEIAANSGAPMSAEALTAEIRARRMAADTTPMEAKVKGIAQGAAFGGADELGALMLSPFVDETYGQLRDQFREADKAAIASNPGAYYTGNFLGALIPGAGMASSVAKARTLPGAIGIGAGWGAGGGATQGFLSGEGGLANRTRDAAIGAGIGGAIGGIIPLAGAGIQRAARAGSDYLRNWRLGGQIGGDLAVSNKSGTVLANILSPDDPAAMRAALDRAGPRAMLADASPTASSMLDATMRSPTPGARVAGERIGARAAAAGDDIVDALSGGVQGPRLGVQGTMDAIRTGAKDVLSDVYGVAYSKPIDYATKEGSKLLDDISPRLPKEAIDYANRLMKLKGEQSGQIMASISDDGMVAFTRPPDVRQWDYIKQALDGLAESGDGAGALGGQTRLGSAYQGLAKEVRDAVAAIVPEYKTALDTASDAITRRKSVQFGADMLSPRVTTDEALAGIADATGAQKAAMREGLRAQVDEIIGNVKAVGSDQNIDAREALKAFTELSSSNVQRKMEALFGDSWPGIKKSLDEAGAALGLRARTALGSQTNPRGVVQDAITDAVTPGALARGKPLPAIGDAWASMFNANPTAIKRMGRDVQGEIADLLTRPGMGQRAVDVIMGSLARNPVNLGAGTGARSIAEVLGLGAVIPATESATKRLKGLVQ